MSISQEKIHKNIHEQPKKGGIRFPDEAQDKNFTNINEKYALKANAYEFVKYILDKTNNIKITGTPQKDGSLLLTLQKGDIKSHITIRKGDWIEIF